MESPPNDPSPVPAAPARGDGGPPGRRSTAIVGLGIAIVLAVVVEWLTTGGESEGRAVPPGSFVVLGGAAAGAVLVVRIAFLRIAGASRG